MVPRQARYLRNEVRMPPDEPKPPSQQIAEDPNKRLADAVVEKQRAQDEEKRGADATEAQVNRDRVERDLGRADKRRVTYEGEPGEAPELDHPGITTRLLEWMRLRGMLSHRELVEILGVAHVRIDHRHPDSNAPETKEVTVNGVTSQQRIGKASIAEDSVSARHYVQELLRPGSTRLPDEREEAA